MSMTEERLESKNASFFKQLQYKSIQNPKIRTHTPTHTHEINHTKMMQSGSLQCPNYFLMVTRWCETNRTEETQLYY